MYLHTRGYGVSDPFFPAEDDIPARKTTFLTEDKKKNGADSGPHTWADQHSSKGLGRNS
jgi:hypothetical protein